MDARADEEDSFDLVPCRVCGRTFVSLSLKKHEKICEKNVVKKRKPFDSFKQRVEGTDIAQFHRKTYLKKPEPVAVPEKKKKRNWKENHLELLSSIRAAKGISPDKEAMPYAKSPSLLSDTKRCPSCDRQFGPKAYDRHVEWCKEKHAHQRLHHSPANVILAKERLEARLKYVPPLNRARKLPVKEKYSSSASTRTESTTSLLSHSSIKAKDKKTYLEKNRRKIENEKKKEAKGNLNKVEEVKGNDSMMAISSLSLTSDSTKSSHRKNSMPSSKTNSPTVNYEVNGITVSSMKCNKTMVTWRDTLNGPKQNTKKKLVDVNESGRCFSTSTQSNNALLKHSVSKNNKKVGSVNVKNKCAIQSKSEPTVKQTPIKQPSVINLDFQTTHETFEEHLEHLTATSEPDFKTEIATRSNSKGTLKSNQEKFRPQVTNKPNSVPAFEIDEKFTLTKLEEMSRDIQIKTPTSSDESVKALLKDLEEGYQLDINLTDFSLHGIPSKFQLDQISPHLDLSAIRSHDTSEIDLRKTFKNIAIIDSCNVEMELIDQCALSKSECEIKSLAVQKILEEDAHKLKLGEKCILPKFSFYQNKHEQFSCNDHTIESSTEIMKPNNDDSLQNCHSLDENTIEFKTQSTPCLSAEIQSNNIFGDKNNGIRKSSSNPMDKNLSHIKENNKMNGLLPKTRTFVISNTNEDNETDDIKPPEINPKQDVELTLTECVLNGKVNNLQTPTSAPSSNEKLSTQPPLKHNLNRSKTESSLLYLPLLYKSDQYLQLSSRKTNDKFTSSKSNQRANTARPCHELLLNKSKLNISKSSNENTLLQKSYLKFSLTNCSDDALKHKSIMKMKRSMSSIDLNTILLKHKSTKSDEESSMSNRGSRYGSSSSLKPRVTTSESSSSVKKRPYSEYVGGMKRYNETSGSSESFSRPVLPKLSSVSTIYKAPYVTSSSENSEYISRAADSFSRGDKQSLTLLYNCKDEKVQSTSEKMIVSLDRFDVKNSETEDSSSSERKLLSNISIPKNNSEETLVSALFNSKESFDIDSIKSNKTSSESLPMLKDVDCISKKFEASLSSENYSVPKKKRRLTDDDIHYKSCSVNYTILRTAKTKFSYKNPNPKHLVADHFLPKITSYEGDGFHNHFEDLKKGSDQSVQLNSADLKLPKIDKVEKSVQVNFYEKVSNRYDRIVIRSRYRLKSPGCISQVATNPFNIAQQQLMELLSCDDFRSITPPPHNTHDDTIPFEIEKAVTPLQTLSVVNTPIKPIKDSLVEFELLESLIEKNLEEDNSAVCSLNGKLPADDTTLIDPSLINENDNLALPEDFRLEGDSPTSLDWHFVVGIHTQKQDLYLTPESSSEQKNMYIITSTPKTSRKTVTTTPIRVNTKLSAKRPLLVNNPKHRKPLIRPVSSVSSEKSVCSEKEKSLLKKESVKTTKSAKTKHLKQEETIDKWLQESNEKNSLEPPFKPEELFNVDDSMYEEFKKYEEMYLKERKQKVSSKKSKAKMIDLSYKILTPGEEHASANNKLTIDSAYGSLTRSAPDHGAKTLILPQLESNLIDNPVIDEYVQSSSPSPTLPKNQQLAKFCHECGNRYPVVTAKFCIECGVRRLIL